MDFFDLYSRSMVRTNVASIHPFFVFYKRNQIS